MIFGVIKTKLVLTVAVPIGVLALISAGYCSWLMTVPLSYRLVPVVLIGFVLAIFMFIVSLVTSFVAFRRLRRSPPAPNVSADQADQLTHRLNRQ